MPILLWLAAQYKPDFGGKTLRGMTKDELHEAAHKEARVAVAWAKALLDKVNYELAVKDA